MNLLIIQIITFIIVPYHIITLENKKLNLHIQYRKDYLKLAN